MVKEYFEQEYQQLVHEWNCSRSEDERLELRSRMARLEGSAATTYGFKFVDALRDRYIPQLLQP